MTEAVKGIVKYAFSQTQIDAIYARILRGNLASIRLFDKCHFKFLYERNEDTNYNESKKVITKAITKEDLPPEYDDVKYEII